MQVYQFVIVIIVATLLYLVPSIKMIFDICNGEKFAITLAGIEDSEGASKPLAILIFIVDIILFLPVCIWCLGYLIIKGCLPNNVI